MLASEENLATNFTLLELRAALQARSEEVFHGGVVVGAVLLPMKALQTLRRLLEKILPTKEDARPKEVDRVGFGMLLMHLRPKACLAFEGSSSSMNEELVAFMSSAELLGGGIQYYSGVRRMDPIFHRTPPHFPTTSLHISPPPRFTFAEVFAGIGGFRLGLEPLGGRCVFASEIDPAARASYEGCFGPEFVHGDICDMYTEHLPGFDLLTAGFPCQPFSTRGDQKGLAEPRGQLYLELVRLLRAKCPRAFLFENVPNLVLMEGGTIQRKEEHNRRSDAVSVTAGKTLELILGAFKDCGYCVTWKLLDARHWLPQYRERVYIVGFRSDLTQGTFSSFLDTFWDSFQPSSVQAAKTVRDIMEPKDKVHGVGVFLTEQQWKKVKEQSANALNQRMLTLDDKCPTLISSYHNHTSLTTKFVSEEQDGTAREIPRFLTPRECARLMGFPESFPVPKPEDEVKRAQFYHQIGNAVCPPVIQSIAERMLGAPCFTQS